MLPVDRNFYLHREHCWVKLERRDIGDLYRIGLDEIFLDDVGIIERLDLPSEGDELSQDEICGVIRGDKMRKLLYAPLSGEIVEVNYELCEYPDIIKEDPYGIGWLLLLDPNDAQEELENLLQGEEAGAWWEKELRIRQAKSS